jgi:hypothetical protein
LLSVEEAQTQLLTAADAEQPAWATSGAVAQTHLLAGGNAAQAAWSTSGAVAQTHLLAGGNATQAAGSTSGAVIPGAATLSADYKFITHPALALTQLLSSAIPIGLALASTARATTRLKSEACHV